jgi:putative ABC transport system substrate-binding protein
MILFSMGGKWLGLLKQIAPSVTRAAVLRTQGSGTSQFAAVQTAASSLGVEVNPINMRDAGEIEGAVTAFARSPNGGLIVTGMLAATMHRWSKLSEWLASARAACAGPPA